MLRLTTLFTGILCLVAMQAAAQVRTNSTDTAALPGYSWVSDTNTGLYNPAADTIGFTTAGAERMNINAAGVVNIGNTAGGVNVYVGDGTDTTTDLQSLVIRSNGYAGLVINGDFGNTSGEPGGAFAAFSLDGNRPNAITGALHYIGIANRNGETPTGLSATDVIANSLIVGTQAASSNGNLQLATGGSVNLTMLGTNGNIGIGRTTPVYPLDVSGTVRATNFIGSGAGLTGLSGDNLGDHTATATLTMGTNAITFSGGTGDKLYWGNNIYGTGLESNTVTTWSPSQFRWRIGGTSVSTGSQQMLLTLTGLNVSGSLSVNNDDSVGSPGFTWNGDTNTGMYWVGADQIGIATGGAQRTLVNSTGLLVTGRISTTGIIDAGRAIYGYAGDSVTAPAYSWSGDTNTGMYWVGADQIGVATGGVQQLLIRSTGLTISGSVLVNNVGDVATAPSYSWSGDTNSGMYWVGSDQIGFTTGGTQRMVVNNAGVGIGVSSPQTALDVGGDVYARGNNIFFSHDSTTNTNNDFVSMYDSSASATGLGNISGFIFYSDATRDQTWDSGNGLIGAGLIYANFGAGIGTTLPSSTLHVMPSFRGTDVGAGAGTGWLQLGGTNGSHMSIDSNEIEARDAGSGATLYLNNNNNGLTNIGGDLYVRGIAYVNSADTEAAPGWTWSGDADTGLWHPAANTIGITTAGTESVRITSAGRVGIGTTAPATLLHVSGTLRVQNGTVVTCNIGTGTGATSCTSDRRLKDHIANIPSALDKISKLNGVTFQWKAPDAPKGEHLGVIAQDVEKVFPQAVDTMETGYKTVDYAILVSPLIEAVKELKAQNEKLQKDVEALRKQVQAQQAK
ncbi:MAG: tail fiber domain-containing protein [Alphaproteobacteria bacterium]|nr:MAG: tail fiber domain-containing protein [Alphaproteobacteria bacterium]